VSSPVRARLVSSRLAAAWKRSTSPYGRATSSAPSRLLTIVCAPSLARPSRLELGVIAGLVMYGWVFGHSAAYHPDPAERDWARAELAWWVPRARRALETWSPDL
jgi:hypothetical protein